MGSVMESVKVINSTVRTLLVIVMLGIIGGGSYWGYLKISEEQRKAETIERELVGLQSKLGETSKALQVAEATNATLTVELEQKVREIEKLLTRLQLLKVNTRLARLDVLSVVPGEEGKPPKSKVRFTELSPSGDPLSDGRDFEFDSDVIYVDNWIVQFDDKFVEAADIEKGTSLCLFRRIFCENQSPTQAYSLDEVGMRPQAYSRGGELSDFEKEIWSKFWDFANDKSKAEAMGIRAANGEAISIQVRPDMSYQIQLRSSGGLSIEPIAKP
jgi:hypothetical protein